MLNYLSTDNFTLFFYLVTVTLLGSVLLHVFPFGRETKLNSGIK
jgi:hypothetical protein